MQVVRPVVRVRVVTSDCVGLPAGARGCVQCRRCRVAKKQAVSVGVCRARGVRSRVCGRHVGEKRHVRDVVGDRVRGARLMCRAGRGCVVHRDVFGTGRVGPHRGAWCVVGDGGATGRTVSSSGAGAALEGHPVAQQGVGGEVVQAAPDDRHVADRKGDVDGAEDQAEGVGARGRSTQRRCRGATGVGVGDAVGWCGLRSGVRDARCRRTDACGGLRGRLGGAVPGASAKPVVGEPSARPRLLLRAAHPAAASAFGLAVLFDGAGVVAVADAGDGAGEGVGECLPGDAGFACVGDGVGAVGVGVLADGVEDDGFGGGVFEVVVVLGRGDGVVEGLADVRVGPEAGGGSGSVVVVHGV